MARSERFEDLIVWQKARLLCQRIYAITIEGAFSRDFALRDQIRRAAISVMSNVSEGYERFSRVEFAHFLSIARGSCGEVRSQLYVAYDCGYISTEEFDEISALAEETSRMLSGLRKSVISKIAQK